MNTEDEIEKITKQMETISSKVNEMSDKLILFEERQKTEIKAREDLSEEFKLLNKTLLKLNNTMITWSGRVEGASLTAKIVWAIFGALFIALLVGATTTIVDLKSEMAIVKNGRKNNG